MNNKKKKSPKQVLKRIFSYIGKYHRKKFVVVCIAIVIAALVSATNTLFIKYLIDGFITPMLKGELEVSKGLELLNMVLIIVAGLYLLGVICMYLYTRLMGYISQGVLKNVRDEMFAKMQKLPISYFDQHTHGEIMSYYTNDTDTLRQLISMSLPQIINCIVMIVVNLVAMFILNWILAIVVIILTSFVILFTKLLVKNSSTYFRQTQICLAKETGFVEEYTDGQKVIKVFNHERHAEQDFDKLNNELCEAATKANKYGNILMPAANNLGNLAYIFVALIGGLLALYLGSINQTSILGVSFEIGVIVAFVNFTKAFINPIGQVSHQLTFVINAMAGAGRIFAFMDELPEKDEGQVKLVNCHIDENGKVTECEEKTCLWAWKKKDKKTNEYFYRPLKGDIVFEDVCFGYSSEKEILHHINLYARPGQKVAFVGATGAGKTTITNLINRFYDIQSGNIRYDGIKIERISKVDLRKSLGIVLQDTNLFTGTIMENIRYGNLEASDEECIEAARLANADGFIRMLPDGYNTMLYSGGNSLSQGQRQLLAIARAAVNNPPVMILDEATSSIDTRTERLVQQGMDALMKNRTVFVIAHRLSTVQNSDVIMVLDHGNIIERGTHEQLIEQKGTYYQLYTGAFELE
ncbi:MAG: ABC transporter ATP-binding protein [Bacilli bacterium]|nr:ABC transporter ATP-binding protein [Bacilli bacterium]